MFSISLLVMMLEEWNVKLHAREKVLLLYLWEKIEPQAEMLGAEVMGRLIKVYPGTRSYFKLDLTPNSADMQTHGGKIFNALGEAIKNNNLQHSMENLADLHMKTIEVESKNYMHMAFCIQVVLARNFPEDFTPKMHTAWTKFLDEVSDVLSGIKAGCSSSGV